MLRRPAPLPASLLLCALLPLAACGGGGATSDTRITNTTVSKGQALVDLKRAYDSGSLSASEYERQRQAILAGP